MPRPKPTRRMDRSAAIQKGFAIGSAVVLAGLAAWLASQPRPRQIACFTTSIADRSPQQLHNIRIAVNALDGARIPARQTLSFNEAAGPYTPARGYVRAPAIIKGALSPAFAGGVCQVSSTLYNAALLADLAIIERHQHDAPVSSVPPGRDAMVAGERADLVIRNTTPREVSVRASISGSRLIICIMGRPERRKQVTIRTSRRDLGPGCFEVTTWRCVSTPGAPAREELISIDRYFPRAPE